ncbi:MAG TPA: nuclear transport factor 2 family protein [Solirubrobacteraceae bacterium]|jgi:ketosteroid isomerase-like protein|nr:nuclear transport factor 2 family protein [Solirubrobacteraceae bacterium]
MTIDETVELGTRYGRAWRTRDPDAILALHAEDAAVRVHVAGVEEATGAAARELLDFVFETLPEMRFESRRIDVREGLIVHEYSLVGTRAGADGVEAPVEVDGIDLIRCADGRVVRKDTYLDSLALGADAAVSPALRGGAVAG